MDGYRVQVHARYTNAFSLWNEVHITSVIPPCEWYHNDNIRDTYEQLKRRISKIVFHWKDENGKYYSYEKDMREYSNYEQLEKEAKETIGIKDVFNINNGENISLMDFFDNDLPFEA